MTPAEANGLDGILVLKQVALFLFLALFLGVVFRLLVGKREVYEARGRIPLSDEPIEPRPPRNGAPS